MEDLDKSMKVVAFFLSSPPALPPLPARLLDVTSGSTQVNQVGRADLTSWCFKPSQSQRIIYQG